MLKKIEKEDFEKEVLNQEGVVLVDFFATWCGPCQMLMPVLEEISKTVPYNIIEIDIDKANELAIEYGIEVVPTLILFKNGEKIKELTGYYEKEELTEILNKSIASL